MQTDPLELAELHLDLLYERDDAGSIRRPRTNDPRIATPRFHLVRTAIGNRWLVAATLSRVERSRLEGVLAREPVISDLGEMEGRPPWRMTDGVDRRGPASHFPVESSSGGDSAERLWDISDVRAVAELSWIREARPEDIRWLCTVSTPATSCPSVIRRELPRRALRRARDGGGLSGERIRRRGCVALGQDRNGRGANSTL